MNDELIGLIPAAGYATRLKYPIAKELWPVQVHDRIFPLIEQTILNMYQAGCDHHVYVMRGDKPEIMKHVSTVLPKHIHKSYTCQNYQSTVSTSPGLVDAINSAQHLIKNKTVLFGMPDTLVQPTECYQGLLELIDQGADIAIGLFKTNQPQKFGMVYYDNETKATFFGDEEINTKNLLVKQIFDKPEKSDLNYMWGILAWKAPFTALIHRLYEDYVSDFAVILNEAIKEGFNVRATIIENGSYFDFGTLSDIVHYNNTEIR